MASVQHVIGGKKELKFTGKLRCQDSQSELLSCTHMHTYSNTRQSTSVHFEHAHSILQATQLTVHFRG